jgi:hypothetical protein
MVSGAEMRAYQVVPLDAHPATIGMTTWPKIMRKHDILT